MLRLLVLRRGAATAGRRPPLAFDGGFEEVEVDVKVAGIKAHEDPARPPKKPNSTRELKIEIRIPADTIALWSGGETAAGARRRVLHVVVPAMSARA